MLQNYCEDILQMTTLSREYSLKGKQKQNKVNLLRSSAKEND